MGWLNNMNDVVLDDAAFEKAIADFSDLAVHICILAVTQTKTGLKFIT